MSSSLRAPLPQALRAVILLAVALVLTGGASGTAPPAPQPLWAMIADEAAKVFTAVAALGAVITAFVAFLEYKTKARSAATQDQIALATAFTDLLGRADGRVATVVSEAAIAKLFDSPLTQGKSAGDIKTILETAGTLGVANGAAAQAAAIECVAYFGCEYPMLTAAAREGLERVHKHAATDDQLPELAERAIRRLRNGC